MDLSSSSLWMGLGSIVVANLLLSGDNAVVIALAARELPQDQRRRAIAFGSALAVALRVVLTLLASRLLALPGLRLAGGVLLAWIAVGLLRQQADGDESSPALARDARLAAAVRTIALADLVMSLDNVVAVAAAAHGDTVLLVAGLALSIPLIVFGSTLVLALVERLPALLVAGAAFLGWLAGDMLGADPLLPAAWRGAVHAGAAPLATAAVVVIGLLLRRRAQPA